MRGQNFKSQIYQVNASSPAQSRATSHLTYKEPNQDICKQLIHSLPKYGSLSDHSSIPQDVTPPQLATALVQTHPLCVHLPPFLHPSRASRLILVILIGWRIADEDLQAHWPTNMKGTRIVYLWYSVERIQSLYSRRFWALIIDPPSYLAPVTSTVLPEQLFTAPRGTVLDFHNVQISQALPPFP